VIISKQQSERSFQELALLSQQGDKAAYRLFLQNITPYIKAAIRKKLGSIVDQEDLTQECLMGIHKNLATYHPSQPIKPWISAIIRYKLADHFRKLSRRQEQYLGDEMLDVTNEATSANINREASSREASEVLGQLPDKLRRVLEMTHIEGLTYGEAAEKEGISEAALRKRISRAFAQVRAEVAKSNMEIGIE
jgi:RNA polymerase sigma-70 factor (ECF subfamily)